MFIDISAWTIACGVYRPQGKKYRAMAKRAASKKANAKSAQIAAFGGAIYQFRIEKNLSQEELSLESDVDRSYLSQLEIGEKEPCLGVIFRLRDALKTTPARILQRPQALFADGYVPTRRPRIR